MITQVKISAMHEYGTSFVGGFLLSVFGNVSWVWQLQVMPLTSHDAAAFAVGFAVKVFATLVLGIIGGLAGLIGRDLYNFLKRKKK